VYPLGTTAVPTPTDPVEGRFRITPTTADQSQPSIATDKPAGQPTTSVGSGDTITVTGSNFTAIAGTKVTLGLTRSGFSSIPLGDTTTTSSGTFSKTFVIPSIPTGEYLLVAMNDYGITATCPFGVTIFYVGAYVNGVPTTTDLKTGMEVLIKGLGFDIFGSSFYTANITIDGQILHNGQNVDHSVVTTNGLSTTIGVDGSILAPGTYTLAINAYVNRAASGNTPAISGPLYAETKITVSEAALLEVKPAATIPRDSTITVTGNLNSREFYHYKLSANPKAL
jgi:hypothetical protein